MTYNCYAWSQENISCEFSYGNKNPANFLVRLLHLRTAAEYKGGDGCVKRAIRNTCHVLRSSYYAIPQGHVGMLFQIIQQVLAEIWVGIQNGKICVFRVELEICACQIHSKIDDPTIQLCIYSRQYKEANIPEPAPISKKNVQFRTHIYAR